MMCVSYQEKEDTIPQIQKYQYNNILLFIYCYLYISYL